MQVTRLIKQLDLLSQGGGRRLRLNPSLRVGLKAPWSMLKGTATRNSGIKKKKFLETKSQTLIFIQTAQVDISL